MPPGRIREDCPPNIYPEYPEGVNERDIDRIGEPFPLTEEEDDENVG